MVRIRLQDTNRHKLLLNKFSTMDELYEFIDLTYLIYRRVDTDLNFADYMRDLMAAQTQTTKER